jgi:hypothetical protein
MSMRGTAMHNVGNTHDTFWHEGQVVISFYFKEAFTSPNKTVIFEKLDQYRLDLNKFLVPHGFTLNFFSRDLRRNGEASIPQSQFLGVDSNTPGVFLFRLQPEIKPTFPLPKQAKGIQTGAIIYFQLNKTDAEKPGMALTQNGNTIDGNERDDHDGDDHRRKHRRFKIGLVPQIVNLINDNLDKLNSTGGGGFGIQIIAASPHMYCGATQDHVTQGCPAIPPIPVPKDVNCPYSPGFWPIELSLGDKTSTIGTGKDVTVFILDTIPNRHDISRAANDAGVNNKLLHDVDKNVTFNYQFDSLVDTIDESGQGDISVAKDIYGRHTNFRLPDHGLFIAGIVHSIASDARIECIRVLNDFCVGDTNVLLSSLQYIQYRMSEINPVTNQQGDLFNKLVVINMSLVIPTDDEARSLGVKTKRGSKKNLLRTNLIVAIQSLVELGAVFAASAGNEGDNPMNPSGQIPDALYPAAFANDKVKGIISVGATNSAHKAAKYSCFPGPLGIATYGGEIPKAKPSKPPKNPPTPGCITKPKAIDALIGIYSSETYPKLSKDDCDPTYPAPNKDAWAYWVGTSFATPIISAILACILEKSRPSYNVPLLVYITNAVLGATGPITWTNLASKKISSPNFVGRMIQVTQCKPAERNNNVQERQKGKKRNKVEV